MPASTVNVALRPRSIAMSLATNGGCPTRPNGRKPPSAESLMRDNASLRRFAAVSS